MVANELPRAKPGTVKVCKADGGGSDCVMSLKTGRCLFCGRGPDANLRMNGPDNS